MTRPLTWPWLRPWLQSGRLSFALRVALLLGWMTMIFMFSADSDSGETSGGVLDLLIGFLTGILGPVGPDVREGLHVLLRKAAHFTEYAVLALLWASVLPRGSRRLWLAFWLTTAYAASDEIHQAFVPNRSPSPVDVVIDASGAATALIALRLVARRLPRTPT